MAVILARLFAAEVAQRQSTAFVKRGLRVQIPSSAFCFVRELHEGKMWIKIVSASEEVLINLDQVSKIEIGYWVPNPNSPTENIFTPRTAAISDERASRAYKLYLGSETFFLPSSPDSPAMKAITKIYKDSLEY
jgi:hypothetical protein